MQIYVDVLAVDPRSPSCYAILLVQDTRTRSRTSRKVHFTTGIVPPHPSSPPPIHPLIHPFLSIPLHQTSHNGSSCSIATWITHRHSDNLRMSVVFVYGRSLIVCLFLLRECAAADEDRGRVTPFGRFPPPHFNLPLSTLSRQESAGNFFT